MDWEPRGPRSRAGSGPGPRALLAVLACLGLLLLGGLPNLSAEPDGSTLPPRTDAPTASSLTVAADRVATAGRSAAPAPPGPLVRSNVQIWSNRTVGAQPSPRSGSGLVWDPDLGKVVLFGGWNGSQAYADTWTYLGGVWSELPLAVHPSPRWGMEMVWDPTDNEIVLFGGWNWTGAMSDTWAFRGTSWVLIHPVVSPPPRDLAGITWDGADGYVLMYGGVDVVSYNDTWSFVKGNWTEQNSTLVPPARNGPGFAYVPQQGGYGGYVLLVEGEGLYYQDNVYTYHAGQWTNITNAVGGVSALPPERDGMDMVWDPAMNATLFALGEHHGFYRNDTWTIANDTFTQLDPSVAPPPTQYAPIAWDPTDGYLVTFGGDDGAIVLDSTWAWGPPLPLKLLGDTVSTTTPSVGSTVYYSSWATGGDPPYTYAWQFGNSQIATGAKVTEAYAWPGTYGVNLTVTDAAGGTASTQFLLTASWGTVTPITVSASANRTAGYAALAVAFSGSASGGYPGYTPSWSFGDTGTASTWNVSHTYAAAGTYTANLTVTDRAGRTGWETVTITVATLPSQPQPLALTAAAVPVSGASPLTVTFSGYASGGRPGYDYTWNFGDGTTAGTTNTTHVYSAPGTYTATLTVTDSLDHTASKSFVIDVSAPSPSSGQGFLGLPGDEGVALIGGAIGVVVGVLLAVVLLRRRQPPGAVVTDGAPTTDAPDAPAVEPMPPSG